MMAIDSNRRMRENRMSGGVGGVTGEIPLPRPDRNIRRSGILPRFPSYFGTSATTLTGPPEPPPIFIGKASIVAPVTGS